MTSRPVSLPGIYKMERIYRKNNFRICTYTPVRIRYVSLFDPCTDMQRRTRAFGIENFRRFYIVHNIALPFMAGMMVVRGILQVLNVNPDTHDQTITISGKVQGFPYPDHDLFDPVLYHAEKYLIKKIRTFQGRFDPVVKSACLISRFVLIEEKSVDPVLPSGISSGVSNNPLDSSKRFHTVRAAPVSISIKG